MGDNTGCPPFSSPSPAGQKGCRLRRGLSDCSDAAPGHAIDCTRYREHLSTRSGPCPGYAIDCTPERELPISASSETQALEEKSFRFFAAQSLAEQTRRAYKADLTHYGAWGGVIPSTPEMIAVYLAEHAASHAPATLGRWLASLSKAHRIQGLPNPICTEIVRATMRGICRTVGTRQRQARPLMPEDLATVLATLGDRPKDHRDRALILLGFAAALRRSELVGLLVEEVDFVPRGALVLVRRSKTDQDGRGRRVAVPNGTSSHCPVVALKAWLNFAGISSGPIFRAVDKHGHIAERPMSGEAVSDVVKTRLEAAGYDRAAYSGHSLRAGFVTAAALAGATPHQIRQTTGHKSDSSLCRYIRNLDPFAEAAICRLL